MDSVYYEFRRMGWTIVRLSIWNKKMALQSKTLSLVGWARSMCPRERGAIRQRWWARAACPPYTTDPFSPLLGIHAMRATVALVGLCLVSGVSAVEPINDKNWEQHATVRTIRTLYNDINRAQKTGKLTKEAKTCELYGGSVVMEGELYRGKNSIVRRYVVDGGSEDSRARAEYYYSDIGVPRFTYRFRGAFNGTRVEERIYFDEKGLHLYTNRKEQGPGYNASGLADSVPDPQSDYADLCNE